jgi:hypothetical protein
MVATNSQDLRLVTDAQRWMTDLLEKLGRAEYTGSVRASCQIVLGCWITSSIAKASDAAEDGAESAFTETATRASELINRSAGEKFTETVDSSLLLLVEVLLSSEGLQVPKLRSFLRQACLVLRREDPVLLADSSLLEKRMLLYRLGLLPRPAIQPSHSLEDVLATLPLTARPDQFERAIAIVECLTGWGTRESAIEHYQPWMREMLEGFAAYRLKQNDLINASRLLRSAAYLEGRNAQSSRSDLYDYLRRLQNQHGSFGYFGVEEAELLKLDSSSAADVELCLPATVGCLWTFAENWDAGWRLLDTMPKCLPYE